MKRRNVLAHACAFVLGFSLIFVVAGVSASAIGQAVDQYRTLITEIFGVVVIALGLNMLGLYRLPMLAMDKRLRFDKPGVSYIGSFLVGIGFAAGWSPCIGPILAAVLAMANEARTVSAGAELLLVYAAGLAIPFLVTAAALERVLPLLTRIKRALPIIETIAGALVTAMGIVLVANRWLWLTGKLYAWFPALAAIGGGAGQPAEVSFGAAFVAGLISFVSPCVLPLVPVYISFLTGQSLTQLTEGKVAA